MTHIEYLQPASLDEVFAMMRRHGSAARLFAGGTDLLVRLRTGHSRADDGELLVLIDLKRVGELRSDVLQIDGHVRIGARAVMTDLIADTRILEHAPALVEAAMAVGSVQIRNRATIAGNLCNASPAADTAPALLAYRAHVNLVSEAGCRQLSLDDFFAGAGRTMLAPGEIVESIDLPLPTEPTGGAFARLTRRRGVDLAIVNLCCVVRESGEVRIACGAVGPRPFVVTSRQDAVLDDVLTHANPISDLRASKEYRTAMLAILAGRALNRAVARMREAAGGA